MKKRIQIMLSPEVEELLTRLSNEEARTRSAIVERAILLYWEKTREKKKK